MKQPWKWLICLFLLVGTLFFQVSCRERLDFSNDEEPVNQEKESLTKVEIKAEAAEIELEENQFIVDKSARVAILGYHDFTDNQTPTQMRIRASKFREQMQSLKESQIPVIPLTDYIAWRRGEKNIPEKCVIITADDGWREFHTFALPILKEFEYPFTMFIYTSYLNTGGRSMSDEQVRDLIANRGEIGSHSVSHSLLTKVGNRTEEDYMEWLRKEIFDSKKLLEERFGIEVSSFAFPYGPYNQRVLDLVTEAGYTSGITVNGAKADYSRPLLELPRYIIHGNNDINWNAATSFAGGGPLANSNNLLLPNAAPDTYEEESAPVQPSEPLIVLSPSPEEIITERLPKISADLSKLEGLIPDSVQMQVSGFGPVPVSLDQNSIASWQVMRPLRGKTCDVSLSLRRLGQEKPDIAQWSFSIDRKANYIKDQINRHQDQPAQVVSNVELSSPSTQVPERVDGIETPNRPARKAVPINP